MLFHYNTNFKESLILSRFPNLLENNKKHSLLIHVAPQQALLCLQSLNLWIDPCIHMPNIFSFLFSFGEQT